MSTYDSANGIDFFNDCLNSLAKELFYDDVDRERGIEGFTPESKIRKSAWVASILASSENDEHRRKALAFGILAYVKYRNGSREELYERYLYIILSRLGDLPAVGNLVEGEERKEFDREMVSSFDSLLTIELGSYLNEYSMEGGGYLSDFQNEIYKALSEGKDVAISGPTSSGKSFILQRYIEARMGDSENFEAIYVVPTRALISEVSSDLDELHEEITVKTGAYFDEEEHEENVFLVVTPERCLKLFREEVKEQFSPELIFFDEFQNIEENERGILFENVIESLKEMWPHTQIVAAGPYLEDPGSSLRQITGTEVEEITTVFAPIFQLKVFLTLKPQYSGRRELDVTILSPSGDEVPVTIDEPDGLTVSKFKSSKKEFLSVLLQEFAEDSQSLVYASRKDWAETWAQSIAADKSEKALSDRAIRLNDFLSQAIHENYSLIECIRHGVAFHHRMLPKIARMEIEGIYRDETDLDTIVSTPTLLQGVNLPAEKIFVHNPSKGPKELTNFDFKNLIGRVGRLNEKLYGSIYCIETEDDEWSREKLDDKGNKEIEPATDRALKSDTDELIETVGEENIYEVDEEHLRYTGIILRNKHLKGGHDLNEYLEKKEVSRDDIDQIKSQLNDRLQGIEIPEGILRRNPTIDPVQQDKLFKAVKESPSEWVLASNRQEYSYDKLLEITRELNEIFLFSNDWEEDVSPSDVEVNQGNLIPVMVTADKWLQGDSYRSMIEARQQSDAIQDEDVNESIRKVMEIINDDVRFVLVKYYRILTDILEEIDEDVSEWMLQFDQMLELGSVDANELELMFVGVDRAVVIDLPIPNRVDDVVEYLEENRHRLSDFYVNHLEEQDVLSSGQ